MLYKRFKRTLDIEMPVSDTIETAGNNGWVADGTRYLKSVLIVFATAFVVATGPQHAEVQQRLPFLAVLPGRARDLESCFIVCTRPVKFAEKFVRLATRTEQA